MTDFTGAYNFELVPFDTIPWHQKEHDNWHIVDAVFNRFVSINNMQGIWRNANLVAIGERYVDGDSDTIWEVLVVHTTPSTGTFSASRVANPTFWQAITADALGAVTWTINTTYQPNQFLIDGSRFGVVSSGHVSTVSYNQGVTDGNITTLLDTGGPLMVDNAGSGAGVSPDGTLHVYTASAGSVAANTSFDDLVIENNVAGGITILTPNSVAGGLAFGDPENNDAGLIVYHHEETPKSMVFHIEGTELFRLSGTVAFINDSTNTKMSIGLTINQGTNGDEILAFKSTTDISHSMTDITEADTYGHLKKISATLGGLVVGGFSESENGLSLRGYASSNNTTKNATGRAAVEIMGLAISGNSAGAMGADANLFMVQNGAVNAARFIVDEDGDLFAAAGTTTNAVTVYDEEDDISLVRAFDIARAGKDERGLIRNKWDEFVSHKEDDLVRMGILGDTIANHGLINVTRLQQLHNGAIWQMHCKQMELEKTLLDVTEQLKRITNG